MKNPVAKHMHRLTKQAVHVDRRKAAMRGYTKHRRSYADATLRGGDRASG